MARDKIRVVGSYHGGKEINYREARAWRMCLRLHEEDEQRVLVPQYWPPHLTPALLAVARIFGVHEYDWPYEVRLRYFGPSKDWPLDVTYEIPF